MFDKLAEELKEARVKNNISLKQLSSKTRIDIKFLEAIEEGNFSFLPELYVQAFLKEFSNVVGLNPDTIVKKYKAAREGLPYEVTADNQVDDISEENGKETKPGKEEYEKPENNATDKKPEETEKFRQVKHSAHQSDTIYSQAPTFDSTTPKRSELLSNNKNGIIIGTIIGSAIILFGLIYLIFFNNGKEIVVPEKPYDEVVNESRQRYEEIPAKTADSLQNSPVTSDSLNLLIHTTDTSWVKLTLDNTKEEEFILFPNSQKLIKAADNFMITFGRSSAIKLSLNNKPLNFDPGAKTVTHVKINSKGLEFLKGPAQAGKE